MKPEINMEENPQTIMVCLKLHTRHISVYPTYMNTVI